MADQLVFKGGTALRTCYFRGYRFSEDLDFTATPNAPRGAVLEAAMHGVCLDLEQRLGEFAPIQLRCERYLEKQPHPDGQEAFVFRTQFPWQREPLTKVMVEVTWGEQLLFSPAPRALIHDFEGDLDGEILTYRLDEIVLEKLRAILQHTKKLHEREWSRSRARDYYDLWHILCSGRVSIEIGDALSLLRKKCAPKEIEVNSTEDFFTAKMLASVRQTWDHWLGRLVNPLPSVENVLVDVRSAINNLLGV